MDRLEVNLKDMDEVIKLLSRADQAQDQQHPLLSPKTDTDEACLLDYPDESSSKNLIESNKATNTPVRL